MGDFAWEAIFHYVKGLPVPDPLQGGQSKLLFDAVDARNARGWSLKALQLNRKRLPEAGHRFEFVIQRASILKKTKGKNSRSARVTLSVGADDAPPDIIQQEISLESPEEDIGAALVKFWNDKVRSDMTIQGVRSGRLSMLLKSRDRREYVYIEGPIPIFRAGDLAWSWTGANRAGFQARNVRTSEVVLKWYHGQTQLFQTMTIPQNATRIKIEPARLNANRFVKEMLRLLSPPITKARQP